MYMFIRYNFQRLFDILFTSVALIVLSPVLILVVTLLAVTGEREIFYRQIRIGRHMNPFSLLKFATMRKDSEKIGAKNITVENDPRVLPLGRLLRKTKINELPQLFNVLKGDMSLIGPRPLVPSQFDMYSIRHQERISSVKPGLSGVGSIIFRDEEKYFDSDVDIEEVYRNVILPKKGKYESWYVDNAGGLTYFCLIVLTILVVVFPSLAVEKHFVRIYQRDY